MQIQKDQLSEIYASHHAEKNRYDYLFCDGARAPYLKEWIGTGKKILDLGCRDGMLTQSFALGNTVIGADIDRQALVLIKQRLGIETHWIDLNAEWPFPQGEFDVIVACELLEHVFFLDHVLDRIKGSLKKGGKVIGSVPNAFRMRNRWKFLLGQEFDRDPTHVRLFSQKKLKQILEKKFQGIEIIPIQGKIAPFLSVSPLFPKRLNFLFAKDLLFQALSL